MPKTAPTPVVDPAEKPAVQRMRWADPQWQACYDRLRNKILDWDLARAYRLERTDDQVCLTFYGWWRLTRQGKDLARWWARSTTTGEWEEAVAGPDASWPNFNLMNGVSRAVESDAHWHANTILALQRLCAADPFLVTQEPLASGQPLHRFMKGNMWRLWQVLETVMTPKPPGSAKKKKRRSPQKRQQVHHYFSNQPPTKLRRAPEYDPKAIKVWHGLRKVLWDHIIDRELSTWAARIYWREAVTLHQYGKVVRQREAVRRCGAERPALLPLLGFLPEVTWEHLHDPKIWLTQAQKRKWLAKMTLPHAQWLMRQPASVVMFVMQKWDTSELSHERWVVTLDVLMQSPFALKPATLKKMLAFCHGDSYGFKPNDLRFILTHLMAVLHHTERSTVGSGLRRNQPAWSAELKSAVEWLGDQRRSRPNWVPSEWLEGLSTDHRWRLWYQSKELERMMTEMASRPVVARDARPRL